MFYRLYRNRYLPGKKFDDAKMQHVYKGFQEIYEKHGVKVIGAWENADDTDETYLITVYRDKAHYEEAVAKMRENPTYRARAHCSQAHLPKHSFFPIERAHRDIGEVASKPLILLEALRYMDISVGTSVADWYVRTGVTYIVVLATLVVKPRKWHVRKIYFLILFLLYGGFVGGVLRPGVPAPADNIEALTHFSQDFLEDNSLTSSLSLILPQSFSSPISTTGIISW